MKFFLPLLLGLVAVPASATNFAAVDVDLGHGGGQVFSVVQPQRVVVQRQVVRQPVVVQRQRVVQQVVRPQVVVQRQVVRQVHPVQQQVLVRRAPVRTVVRGAFSPFRQRVFVNTPRAAIVVR